jgi:hypothetical protein
MQTSSDYYSDAGLGFGIDSPYDDAPELRRASDCGGSEIYFRCDDATMAGIESEINGDEQCGPDDDGPEGSDSGLTQFWRIVDRVIRADCGLNNVWDDSASMLADIAKEA